MILHTIFPQNLNCFAGRKTLFIMMTIFLFSGVLLALAPYSGTSHALKLEADFGNSNGVPALTDGTKFRINKIFVNFQDPATGQTISGRFDVIFQWDEENWVLKPVEALGCYNGSLRVHVADSTTGDPIEGAQVTANGKTMVTDEDGIARFKELLNDRLIVHVEAESYNPNGFEVEIPCNGEQRVSTALMPKME